jgi:NADPH:quinone reductase-like Zn-dependent oxidoreductase
MGKSVTTLFRNAYPAASSFEFRDSIGSATNSSLVHLSFVSDGLLTAQRRRNMKAVVVHQYGGPEVLKFEEYPDPVPGPGEVLVRVAATSVNPIDYKRRAGLTKDFYPIQFPGLIGVDIAGTVVKIGPGVEGFSVGDQVFAMADNTYAELCVVKAAILAKVPKGLDLIQAAALPLVTTTGNQLMSATGIKAGQTVLVLGAAGNVGRSAVFTAKQREATVIAGVLKRQMQMDDTKTVRADQMVATDDDTAIANLAPLDAVADTVGGKTAEKLIAKVKPGGVYASVVEPPQNAAKYPSVKVVHVFSKFDRKTLEFMAEAVRDGKLVIPISQKLPLSEAAEAQAAAEKGGIGKILLVA